MLDGKRIKYILNLMLMVVVLGVVLLMVVVGLIIILSVVVGIVLKNYFILLIMVIL